MDSETVCESRREFNLSMWEITGGNIDHLKRSGFEVELYEDEYGNCTGGKAVFKGVTA